MRKQAKWLLALGLVLTLAGCGKNAAASTSASGTNTPKVVKLANSGVVSAAKMTSLSKSGHDFSFTGKAKDGVTYRWDYTAAQVKNPTKQKLGLKLTTKNKQHALTKVAGASDALGFKLGKFYLAGSPTLTITIPKHWSATAAVLLNGKHAKLAANQPVTITRTANSTKLAFRVTAVHKTFYIVGTSKQNKAKVIKKADVATKKSAQKAASTKVQAKAAKASGASSSTKRTSASTSAAKASTSSSSKHAATSSRKAVTAGTAKVTSTRTAKASTKTSTAAKNDAAPTVTISISAATAAKHLSDIDSNKRAYVPADGWILPPTKVKFTAGESVYDVLKTVTRAHGIQMESRYTPMYNAYYIKGINNLYEFDGGSASGWMYSVDGWFPNYGCSAYNSLKNGSTIKWQYTLELGADIGGSNY